MKTKTLKEVKVYETQNCENLLATLPPGYEIEILLNNKESLNLIKEESLDMRHPVFGSVPCFSMPYFVRTSFGLCGWARLRLCQYMEYDIEGLMYNGD